ncbi:unnamed protein product, partial [Prorocentrum cordatum]
EDLDRNGKIDVDDAAGTVHLREKQKGCGWYIPPPKKPKPGGRGRGSPRGGAARARRPPSPPRGVRSRRGPLGEAAAPGHGRAQPAGGSDLRGAVMGRLRALRQDIPLDLNR